MHVQKTTHQPRNPDISFPSVNNPPEFQANPFHPQLGPTVLALTLKGSRMARDDMLQLIAVGVNVVEGFSFHSKLVALFHFAGAAGWTLVLAYQQIHIWKSQAERPHVRRTLLRKKLLNFHSVIPLILHRVKGRA